MFEFITKERAQLKVEESLSPELLTEIDTMILKAAEQSQTRIQVPYDMKEDLERLVPALRVYYERHGFRVIEKLTLSEDTHKPYMVISWEKVDGCMYN